MRIRELSEEAYLHLLRTSRKQVPASLWIKGGQVLNVYTREWQQVHVVVSGERIAYVGEKEPLVDEQTEILDATGYFIVPGYIEPHAHPFQWYNPSTLSDFALQTGTTTMIADTLMLAGLLPFEDVEKALDQLSRHPVKQLFWARLDPQIHSEERSYPYTKEGMSRLIDHPLVIQGGELTDWRGVLAEDDELLFGLKRVRDQGKRLEGHHPGASAETLNTAAAAGITACHESITAEDVVKRLRLGMYATLRHSSIRLDIPELVDGLMRLGVPWNSRLMLTSDGSSPQMMKKGFMDYTIRVAIESGVPPIDAYIMGSLNPAVYYGLDAEVGGIAPGRLADMLLLETPADPTPQIVIANGKRSAEGGVHLCKTEQINWQAFRFPKINEMLPNVDERWFNMHHPGKEVPILDMVNAVITKLEMQELPKDEEGYVSLQHHPELAFITLIDPKGKHITQAVVRGYGSNLAGLASTYTASADWIVIGRDPLEMAKALQEAIEMGGGVVYREAGETLYQLQLQIAGKMSDLPMEQVIAKGEEFVQLMRSKGHQHIDPVYSLLFFTATHLPFVRLSAEGIYDVKRSEIIFPSAKF